MLSRINSPVGADLVVSDTSYDGIDALIRGLGVPRAATNLWRSPPPDERVGERFLSLLLADGLISEGSVAPPLLRLAPEERASAARELADLGRPLAFSSPTPAWRSSAGRRGRGGLWAAPSASVTVRASSCP